MPTGDKRMVSMVNIFVAIVRVYDKRHTTLIAVSITVIVRDWNTEFIFSGHLKRCSVVVCVLYEVSYNICMDKKIDEDHLHKFPLSLKSMVG